ncbi:hypothetical protein Tco_0068224, partial [Tanacetum coccineum]
TMAYVNVNAPVEQAPAMAPPTRTDEEVPGIVETSEAPSQRPTCSRQGLQVLTTAHAKPQEKKRKLVIETSEASSPAKRSKAGKVTKKRKPKSSLQLIDEGVPDKEPLYGDEEADRQRAIEESL